MTTESHQHPLAHVHPLAREPQGVGPVAQVGPDRQVTLCDLGSEDDIIVRASVPAFIFFLILTTLAGTSNTMYSSASRDMTESKVPEVARVRRSSWMLVRRLLLPPARRWNLSTLLESKENSGTTEGAKPSMPNFDLDTHKKQRHMVFPSKKGNNCIYMPQVGLSKT